LKVLGILSFALTKPISSGEGSFAEAQWQQSVLNYGEADLIGERMGERMGNVGPNSGEARVHRSTEPPPPFEATHLSVQIDNL
jgi:hypothetical protein